MNATKEHHFEAPSEQVQILLPDGRVILGPRGTTVEGFLKPLQAEGGPLIVGAVVNGTLRELTYQINLEANVRPVTMADSDGMHIYRRSLTFLLGAVFEELFPGVQLIIDHSVSFGGYFCRVNGRAVLTQAELDQVAERMRELATQDLPVLRQEAPLAEAIEIFRKSGQEDKVRLLTHRKKDYLILYDLNGHRDYHHGYMVPSSGYLKWFDLTFIEGGFTLRFPRRESPEELSPLGEYPKLLATFREYGDWLETLGIDSVGALNDSIHAGRIRELVLVSEALHEQRIAEIARQIAARKDQVRVVLIAGPSSSGKTTTSRRLSIQLLAHGLHPYPLELDNFFVDRDKTPRDAHGNLDFEHLDAIDRARLNHDLNLLIQGKRVQLPHYDFHTGLSGPGREEQLAPNQIVIVEGIHGLNPELLSGVAEGQLFRIYISALTQLNLDHHNRVSTTDNRLLRRIVRDARTRGYSPQQTIARWESVRRGEKRFIFPYQENADVIFNSALVYELAVLKQQAEPLLRQVPFGGPEHVEVKRLLALLEWFLPLDAGIIPDNSLLREFIGGSILEDFRVWVNP